MEFVEGSSRERFTWYDWVLITTLAAYGMVASVALLMVPRFFMPAEDAVILWGYSRNLAMHGAITYIAGGPHTEGATDFAWMLLVAGAMRCGIDPFVFTAIVNVVCLIGLAMLLVHLAGARLSMSRVLVVMGAACLFPQAFAAASGFATLPDAFLLTLLVVCVLKDRAWTATFVALLFCLFRPDGVVFAVPLLLMMTLSGEMNLQRAAKVLVVFGGLGASYFFWRVWYFGELFPLPFLVKSDAQRVIHTVIVGSVRTSLVFLLFSLLALLPVWRSQNNSFGKRLAVCLLVIPTLFYWGMRLDQNVGFRFFFYIPLAAGILVAVNWDALCDQRTLLLRGGFAAWLVLMAMPMRRELRTFLDLQSPDLQDIAEQLGRLQSKGTMLSSEAGILPYYSEWASVDPWGLNTAEFAHRFFQAKDVGQIAPDLIHLHADENEHCVADPSLNGEERTWPQLIHNLVAGADPAKYDLWLTSYGSAHYRLRKHWRYGEGDRDCWFVRKDAPTHDAIVGILATYHGVGGTTAQALEMHHVIMRVPVTGGQNFGLSGEGGRLLPKGGG